MSLIKAIQHQIGLSGTPANNFTLTAQADNGTMKLARGNAGAQVDQVLFVDAVAKTITPGDTYNVDPIGLGRQFLVRGAFGLGTDWPTEVVGDMGSVPGSGFYSFGPGVTGRPTNINFGVLLHLAFSTSGGGNWAQFVIPTSPAGAVWYRSLTNGVNNGWRQLVGHTATPTWRTVTRVAGTTYTNDTGAPIILQIYQGNAGSLCTVTVGGYAFPQTSTPAGTATSSSYTIPAGATYSYVGAVGPNAVFSELRP